MPRKTTKKDVGVYRVEAIMDQRRKNGKVQYKVKWEGYLEPSWIPASLGAGCQDLINTFKRDNLPPGSKYSPIPSDNDCSADEEMVAVQSSRTERPRKEMNKRNATGNGGVLAARRQTGSDDSVASLKRRTVEDGISSRGRSPNRLPSLMAAGDRRGRRASNSSCPYSPLRIETSDDDDDGGEIAAAARAAESASSVRSRVDNEPTVKATVASRTTQSTRAPSPVRIGSDLEVEGEVPVVVNGTAKSPSPVVPVKRGRGRPRKNPINVVQQEKDKKRSSSPARPCFTPGSADVIQSEEAVEEREKSAAPTLPSLPSDDVDVIQISSDDDNDEAMESNSAPRKLVRIPPLDARRSIYRWKMDEREEEEEREEDRFLQRDRRLLQRVFARRREGSSGEDDDDEQRTPRQPQQQQTLDNECSLGGATGQLLSHHEEP